MIHFPAGTWRDGWDGTVVQARARCPWQADIIVANAKQDTEFLRHSAYKGCRHALQGIGITP